MRTMCSHPNRAAHGLLAASLAAALCLLPAGTATAASFQAPVSQPVGAGPVGLLAADLDRDGAVDIVTADQGADGITVLLGDGDGGFAVTPGYLTGGRASAVAAADLNRDGALDLVVANERDDTLTVLLGDGGGAFSIEGDLATTKKPTWVGVGDLDSDGHDDIVSVGWVWGDAVVHLGLGDGTFAAGVSYSVGSKPGGGVLADLDGDGDLDLVTADYQGGDVKVMLGDGLGGFESVAPFAAGSGPRAVLVHDLDRNGTPDIVVSNQGGDSVSILYGDGAGGFSPGGEYPAVEGAWGLAWVDFDGDCGRDLAVAGSGSGELAVLASDGVGGFLPPELVAVGDDLRGLVVGDFNGDLRADVVVDADLDLVSVLAGNPTEVCTLFEVRRSTDPAAVATAPIHALVDFAPTEDYSGVLSDGVSYFYEVEHAGGLPLLLSAHANPADDTVRLGFADGDPLSAPVDSLVSSVQASTTLLPADGVTTATVTIRPTDAAGIPVGSGLDIQIDESFLLPGVLDGPLQDLGDGTYQLRVLSSLGGAGLVSVQVEGIALADAPVITYTP